MTDLTPEQVRDIVGPQATDAEAQALIEWYAALSRGVAAFPAPALKQLEPPLRSMPGPR